MSNYTRDILSKKSKAELLELAMQHNIPAYKKMNKSELIDALIAFNQKQDGTIETKNKEGLWAKYSNHIYGLASLIGLVIAIYALNPGGEKTSDTLSSTNSLITNPDILPAEIRDKNVAVMIFEDETHDEDLSAVGKMISDWITTGLMDINKGKVISGANVRDNIAFASLGGGAQQNFADRTGAVVLVQGRYYKVENQIYFHADIVNARSGAVIKSLETISGQKENIMDLIDELSQRVLGFWATSKNDRYYKKPPKFKAYQALVVASENWLVNDAIAEQKLHEAFQLDTTFILPLLSLSLLYNNHARYAEIKPLIEKIESLDTEFSDYEQLRLRSIKANASGDYRLSIKTQEELTAIDVSFEQKAAESNLFHNRPLRALHYYQRLNAKPDGKLTWWDQQDELRQAECLFRLGRHQEVEAYMDSLDFKVVNDWFAGLRLKNLIVLNDWARFDSLIVDYSEIEYEFLPAIGYACIYMYIHDIPQLSKYIDVFKEAHKKNGSNANLPGLAKLYYDFIIGDHASAMESPLIEIPMFYYAKASILYAMGKEEEAKQLLLAAERNIKPYLGPGDFEYNRAYYHAMCGEKEKAMTYLEAAYEAGKHSIFLHYGEDIGFKSMHGYPPFDEFIKPKG